MISSFFNILQIIPPTNNKAAPPTVVNFFKKKKGGGKIEFRAFLLFLKKFSKGGKNSQTF